MIGLLRVLVVLVGLAGISLTVYWAQRAHDEREGREEDIRYHRKFDDKDWEPPELKRYPFWLSVGMILIAPIVLFVLSGAAVVGPKEIGVVENNWTGQMYPLRSGTHVWPFSRRLVPIVTKVTTYSLSEQLIEIGAPPKDAQAPEGQSLTQAYGIPSASSSPGQPVVFIYGRGYATVNPEAIVELHRRYGQEYDDAWVEPQWVSTIKEVQGRYPFDYLKEKRGEMQNEVEAELQAQLVSEDSETPLVYVSQLAIRDYDYTADVNSYLNTVAQREFARQEQEAQREVNLQEQEARKIKAETEYLVQVRAAEAQRDSRIAEAEGEAERQKQLADAQAYETRVTYQAEAEGIEQVVRALRGSGEYTEYIRAQTWDGTLPTWWMPGQDGGHTPIPLLETSPGRAGE